MRQGWTLAAVLIAGKAAALDYRMPIYSTGKTIVCPYSLLIDPRMGVDKVRYLFSGTPLSYQQAGLLGCTPFRSGIQVEVQRLDGGLLALTVYGARVYPYITVPQLLSNTRVVPPIDNSHNTFGKPEPLLKSPTAEEVEFDKKRQEAADAEQVSRRDQIMKDEEAREEKQRKEAERKEQELLEARNYVNCGDDGVCRDAPDERSRKYLEEQWYQSPAWLRDKCLKNKKFTEAENCIAEEGISYLKEHPGPLPSWFTVTPKN